MRETEEVYITREFRWDAAHRLMNHEGKCSTWHGHGYRALVTLAGMIETDSGMVLDYSVIKGIVGYFLDERWDHTVIISGDDPMLEAFMLEHNGWKKRKPFVLDRDPTAEVMAEHLFFVIEDALEASGLRQEVHTHEVTLYETPSSSATVCAGRDHEKIL